MRLHGLTFATGTRLLVASSEDVHVRDEQSCTDLRVVVADPLGQVQGLLEMRGSIGEATFLQAEVAKSNAVVATPR